MIRTSKLKKKEIMAFLKISSQFDNYRY